MVYKFSELFHWSSGKPVKLDGGAIPVYGSNGIIGYTTKAKYRNKIILGRVGAYCGSVEYYPGSFNASDNTLITTCNEDLVLYKYAYYLLKQYKLNNFSGGSAQPLITQSLLKPLKCDIPEIKIQERIASVLSAYDDLIENNNKRIKILEQMAENLYKEWFIRFRFPGHEQAEFENGIPKGWEIRRFSDNIAKITAGGDRPEVYSPYKSDICTVPIFSNGTDDYGLYGYTNHPKIYEESVTVSARGTVGYVCLREKPYVPIVRLLSLVPVDKEISAKFIYYALKTDCIEGNGTSQQQMTVPMFGRKKILIPDRKLIAKFTAIVDDLFSLRRNHMIANQNLTKQRDLLLPRLMSGKLEV